MKQNASHIVGERFGKMTVTKFNSKSGSYTFLCECGRARRIQKTATLDNIFLGRWKTCGYPHALRHGLSGTRFHTIWSGIKQRTQNENCETYWDYGARGIKICGRWLKFEDFRDDMYESYCAHAKKYGEKNTSIHRVDSNGHYKPENCKWATLKEQAQNKSGFRIPLLCEHCPHCKKVVIQFIKKRKVVSKL